MCWIIPIRGMQFGLEALCWRGVQGSKNPIIHGRNILRKGHRFVGIMLYLQDDIHPIFNHNFILDLLALPNYSCFFKARINY